MRSSFVTTVFNEEETISKLLESLIIQTISPDEIIIVDANSSDRTKELILHFIRSHKDYNIKLIIKKGNRSVGRNEGIGKAKGDIILLSDAGCILDKSWAENILKPFGSKNIEVVAGYYSAKPNSVFEKCLIPYVLVMPDRVNPKTFLPASRTMAMRKTVWKKLGGFPENLSHNEDYALAQKMKREKIKIFFQQSAVVYWIPRKNLYKAFVMFFRFALGDAQSRIFRPKVLLIFARYIFAIVILVIYKTISHPIFLISIIAMTGLYIVWSIGKNYKYVGDINAFYILPILQITSDLAVLAGTILGFFKKH